MSEIILDASLIHHKNADTIMDELEVLDASPNVPLSKYNPNKKEKKKKDEVEQIRDASEESTEDWLDAVANFRKEPIRTTSSRGSGIFDFVDSDGRKKKKKKKKGKNDLTDYRKEFEPEMMLFQNLLEEQTKFTNSLQRRYDTLAGTKSAARGTGKFTTDLISQINEARKATASFAGSVVSLKKTIADLQMKEKKEFGSAANESEDLGSYSASFLKKMISQDRNTLASYGGDVVPFDGDADDLFKNVEADLELSGEERPDEVEKYMKYGTNVELRVLVDKNTNQYQFEAVDRTTGDTIDDYPLPTVAHLDINSSTGMASDEYYNRYPVVWI